MGYESGRSHYLASAAPFLSMWRLCSDYCILLRACHGTAILVSRTRQPRKPMQRAKELVDFHGYKDPCYTLLAIGSFVASLGLYSPYSYIRELPSPVVIYLCLLTHIALEEPFAAKWDVPASVHDNLLSIMNGVSIVGRIMCVEHLHARAMRLTSFLLSGGQIADRYGLMNILSLSTFLSGVFCVALWLPAKSPAPLVVFACIYGQFT